VKLRLEMADAEKSRMECMLLNIDKRNFQTWFKYPLQRLLEDEHAGFPILMICLPLLERYLRQKSGSFEGNLNGRYHRLFQEMFSLRTDDEAREFWQIYRNGLLHQATFSKATQSGKIMPKGSLISSVEVIGFDEVKRVFMVSPKRFAERVIQIIETDFITFEQTSSPNHPLAEVSGSGYTITPEPSLVFPPPS